MSPAEYAAQRKLAAPEAGPRAGGAGATIRWRLVDSVLGRALVAATQRGICMIELGKDAAALEATLRNEFPRASLQREEAGRDDFLAPRLQAVAMRLSGGGGDVDLDLLGTVFQKKVWDALMRIPSGQTRSYAQLASGLAQPHAARAVASACARNKVAILVPCHRVIRADGALGGYRWGLPLKQQLLARECAE